MGNGTRSRRALIVPALALACAGVLLPAMAGAEQPVFEKKRPRNPDDIIYGGRGVTDRTIIAGICSVFIPGIGQAINEDRTPKVLVHLALGLPAWLVFDAVTGTFSGTPENGAVG